MKKVSLDTALGVIFTASSRKSKKDTNLSKQEKKELKTYYFDNYGKTHEIESENTVFKCEAENNKKAKFKFKEWKRKNSKK